MSNKVRAAEALPEKPVKKITSFGFAGHTRHWILGLGTLSLAILLGCAISFNPAIVVMMDLHSSPFYNHSTANFTSLDLNSWDLPLAHRRFAYSNTQKMILLASAFGGCLICFLPITMCMQRFGAWHTQLAIGIIVSLSTALIPLAATSNFYLLCIVRFFAGTAFTNLFPVVGSITTNWSPLAERGLFLAVLSGYIQLSVVISFPLAGILAQTVGWPWVFYMHAFLGFFIFSVWALFYRDHPQVHPWVSEEELQKIEFDQQAPIKNKEYKPPYTKILSSSSIWAILIAVVGNFSIIQFANTFLPMFLRTALDYSISSSGLISAIPLFFQFIVKWLTGYTTDHLTSIPDLIKVRFCNSVAFCGTAFFFCVAIFLPTNSANGLLVVAALTCAISVLGLSSGGFTKSVVLVSKQYTPTVMALLQMCLTTTLFFGSFLIPYMTPQGNNLQYDHVFWMYVFVLLATNLVFMVWGKAEPANWTIYT